MIIIGHLLVERVLQWIDGQLTLVMGLVQLEIEVIAVTSLILDASDKKATLSCSHTLFMWE